jgi:hypothetical protein
MARPQIADGGDGLQIWRVAANISKQSRTADTGWSFSLEVECGTNNSSRKTQPCCEIVNRASDLAGFYEQGNEMSGCINSAECSDCLSDYWLSNEDTHHGVN